jgi:hypothetical protein
VGPNFALGVHGEEGVLPARLKCPSAIVHALSSSGMVAWDEEFDDDLAMLHHGRFRRG